MAMLWDPEIINASSHVSNCHMITIGYLEIIKGYRFLLLSTFQYDDSYIAHAITVETC
jgi:hypothetical protein